MPNPTLADAQSVAADLTELINTLGQQITVVRPGYYDEDGLYTDSATFSLFCTSQRLHMRAAPHYEPLALGSSESSNEQILTFPIRSDLREGDLILYAAGTAVDTYRVTRVDGDKYANFPVDVIAAMTRMAPGDVTQGA